MSKLTRRAMLRGTPAAAIAAVAVPSMSAGGRCAAADDTLLDLESAYHRAVALAVAACLAAEDADRGSPLDVAADHAWDAVAAIEEQIIARPAAGLDGILAKMRLARASLADRLDDERLWPIGARLAYAAGSDLERLAAGGAL